METLLNCSTGGWAMIAGAVLIYGVLGLSSVALIKYLMTDRSSTVHFETPVVRYREIPSWKRRMVR